MDVAIHLRHAAKEELRAWLTLRVTAADDDRLRALPAIAAAVAADPTSFLHPPTPVQAKAIADELMTGLLRAKRAWKAGFAAELLALGGASGDIADPCRVPGIAYAVAGFLAAGQALGHLDLAADPMGGHGWKLESFDCQG